MRTGTYHATYIVRTVEEAVALVRGMQEGVISSFGEGDEQWEGIDLADPGAVITIHTFPPKGRHKLRHGDVYVEVRVPVAEVPKNYWLSPFLASDVEDTVIRTFTPKGVDTHGDPCNWGIKFLQPQRLNK